MGKIRKQLVFAFVALGVLIIALVILLTTAPKKNEPSQTESQLITLLDKKNGDVSKIEIKNSYGEYSVLRGENRKFTIPELTAINDAVVFDEYAINYLLLNCASLNAERLAEENPENLSDYGLEPPQAEYYVEFEDGTSFKAAIGYRRSASSSVFMYVNGDKSKVYLASRYQTEYVAFAPVDFVSTDIFTTLVQKGDTLIANYYAVKYGNGELKEAVYFNEQLRAINGDYRYIQYKEPRFPLGLSFNDVITDVFSLVPLKVVSVNDSDFKPGKQPEYTIELNYSFAKTSEEKTPITINIYDIDSVGIYNSEKSSEIQTQVRYASFSKYPGIIYAIPVSFNAFDFKPESYFERNITNLPLKVLKSFEITANSKTTKFDYKGDGVNHSYLVNGKETDKLNEIAIIFAYIKTTKASSLISEETLQKSKGTLKYKYVFDFNIEGINAKNFEFYDYDEKNYVCDVDGKTTYLVEHSQFADLSAFLSSVI